MQSVDSSFGSSPPSIVFPPPPLFRGTASPPASAPLAAGVTAGVPAFDRTSPYSSTRPPHASEGTSIIAAAVPPPIIAPIHGPPTVAGPTLRPPLPLWAVWEWWCEVPHGSTAGGPTAAPLQRTSSVRSNSSNGGGGSNPSRPVRAVSPIFDASHLIVKPTTVPSPESPNNTPVGGYNWLDSVRSLGVFDTAEGFWALQRCLMEPSGMPVGSSHFIFRRGIPPMWEHEANRRGGKFVAAVPSLTTTPTGFVAARAGGASPPSAPVARPGAAFGGSDFASIHDMAAHDTGVAGRSNPWPRPDCHAARPTAASSSSSLTSPVVAAPPRMASSSAHDVDRLVTRVCLMLIGEQLAAPEAAILGLSVSRRKSGWKVALWVRDVPNQAVGQRGDATSYHSAVLAALRRESGIVEVTTGLDDSASPRTASPNVSAVAPDWSFVRHFDGEVIPC